MPFSGCQNCNTGCDAVCTRSGCNSDCHLSTVTSDISISNSYTIDDNKQVVLTPNGCTYPKIVVNGDLTISTYASIIAEPMPSACNGASSGGTGGATGGSYWTTGGYLVADESVPGLMRGGSAGEGSGSGLGGGVIDIEVTGTLFLYGSIQANGEGATASTGGGGSGGSIRIKCAELRGDTPGRIEANGGTGSAGGGGGAGGEVTIDSPSVLFPTAFIFTRGALGGVFICLCMYTCMCV